MINPGSKHLAGGLGVLEGATTPATSPEVPELLRLANLARADGGLLNEAGRQVFIDHLPVLKDEGGLEASLLARATDLLGSSEGLKLNTPQSPGFSGAAIFIVEQHGKPVMVAKVSPFDALLGEVSTQAMLIEGGFNRMPQVFAMAKLATPTSTGNVAVQLMGFSEGQNIARESWWLEQQKTNPGKPAEVFARIGEALAELHQVKQAAQVHPSRVDGMTVGRMPLPAFNRFMEGESVVDVIQDVPSAVPTAQNLGVSNIEWLARVMSAKGLQKLGVLDFPQLEGLHRELTRRFRQNPGPAAVAHGDFHQGQLSVGEQRVNVFDLELLAKNVDADGTPLLSPAYDLAAMLVNMRYFARYAGFSQPDIQHIEATFLRSYEKAGGKRPTDDQLDFFKLWRQTWVMSLFQDAPPIETLRNRADELTRAVSAGDQSAAFELAKVQKQIDALVENPPAVDPMKVRAEMANTLADVAKGAAARLSTAP